MRVGLLSDTHNHLGNLAKALEIFRQEGVKVLIHCGDLTSNEVALLLVEFQVICTFGNGDIATSEIKETLAYYNPDNYSSFSYQGELWGKRIAVTHGHIPHSVNQMAESGRFDYVIHGHSHRRGEKIVGTTHVINPGALGGRKVESRSCAVLDLEIGELRFHLIC
jgi:hypothetical protein